MEIIKEFKDSKLNVIVKGQIDTMTAPDLEKEVLKDLPKAEEIVLDLLNVDYVSSAGLRVLLGLHKKQKDKNRTLLLKNVNADVMTILEMTGFTSFLKIN